MRHFLGLYLLIVTTLAMASWGQDKVSQIFGAQESEDDRVLRLAMLTLQDRLETAQPQEWKRIIADADVRSGIDLELFAAKDVAGPRALEELDRGGIAQMRTSKGDAWTLKRIDDQHILALKIPQPPSRRGLLDWAQTLVFYAVIALVLMIWIWPLRRDLGVLQRATALYGNRNWRFDARIGPRSQIYPLAEAFRTMASRIDSLIASHKDMSNAVSHEIKTPLARMQFEIESAQCAQTFDALRKSLLHIKDDISAIDSLVTATMSYAILERADMSLKRGRHNFSEILPALVDHVRRDVRPDILTRVDVIGDAQQVGCDVHLMETVLKNLLYNAARYAKREIQVRFESRDDMHQLIVDDDGPGIPEADRVRVFDSFVQLDPMDGRKQGFGLGLAIVRRALEWHHGQVSISRSPLGGARICATWPEIFV